MNTVHECVYTDDISYENLFAEYSIHTVVYTIKNAYESYEYCILYYCIFVTSHVLFLSEFYLFIYKRSC